MMESEFRDWTRGQLRSLDERLRRLAEGPPAAARVAVDRRIHDSIVNLGQKLVELAKAGKVIGAAIVYVDDEDKTMTGWSADGGYFALAGAATFMGLEILEEFRKAEVAANDSQPAGHAGADEAPAVG
jgi:hypothetical protein